MENVKRYYFYCLAFHEEGHRTEFAITRFQPGSSLPSVHSAALRSFHIAPYKVEVFHRFITHDSNYATLWTEWTSFCTANFSTSQRGADNPTVVYAIDHREMTKFLESMATKAGS